MPRVHCDYTVAGAPRRLRQLGEAGIFSHLRGRTLTSEEATALAAGHFAFINVWRSIDPEHPVLSRPLQPCASQLQPCASQLQPYASQLLQPRASQLLQPRASQVLQQPLAVCDERSVPEADRFLYELRFPDRTGENYSLRHSAAHRWYSYSCMTKDECLLFKVYDRKEDGGPRFVFHTAFTDPASPLDAPPRRSIEVRAIVFYDPPPIAAEELASSSTRATRPHGDHR